MTNEDLLKSVLQTEGGFVNDPADPGGPTNHGVTAVTLGGYRHLGRPATEAEVKALTETEALNILMQIYITAPGFTKILNPEMRRLVVDMWINHGASEATRLIQKALKLPGDGIMGPMTLNAINNDYEKNFKAILAERIRFYGRRVVAAPSQVKFLNGWLDRAADFLSPN